MTTTSDTGQVFIRQPSPGRHPVWSIGQIGVILGETTAWLSGARMYRVMTRDGRTDVVPAHWVRPARDLVEVFGLTIHG